MQNLKQNSFDASNHNLLLPPPYLQPLHIETSSDQNHEYLLKGSSPHEEENFSNHQEACFTEIPAYLFSSTLDTKYIYKLGLDWGDQKEGMSSETHCSKKNVFDTLESSLNAEDQKLHNHDGIDQILRPISKIDEEEDWNELLADFKSISTLLQDSSLTPYTKKKHLSSLGRAKSSPLIQRYSIAPGLSPRTKQAHANALKYHIEEKKCAFSKEGDHLKIGNFLYYKDLFEYAQKGKTTANYDCVKQKLGPDNDYQKKDNCFVQSVSHTLTSLLLKKPMSPRLPTQYQIMNNLSAKEVAESYGFKVLNICFEWLHLVGYQFNYKNAQTRGNLILGTRASNTLMMFVENEIKGLIKICEHRNLTASVTIQVEATKPDPINYPNFANHIKYTIDCHELQVHLVFEFNPLLVSIPEKNLRRLVRANFLAALIRNIIPSELLPPPKISPTENEQGIYKGNPFEPIKLNPETICNINSDKNQEDSAIEDALKYCDISLGENMGSFKLFTTTSSERAAISATDSKETNSLESSFNYEQYNKNYSSPKKKYSPDYSSLDEEYNEDYSSLKRESPSDSLHSPLKKKSYSLQKSSSNSLETSNVPSNLPPYLLKRKMKESTNSSPNMLLNSQTEIPNSNPAENNLVNSLVNKPVKKKTNRTLFQSSSGSTPFFPKALQTNTIAKNQETTTPVDSEINEYSNPFQSKTNLFSLFPAKK